MSLSSKQACAVSLKSVLCKDISLLDQSLLPSQEFQKIMSRLKYSNEERFTKALNIWYLFINEITIYLESGKSSYTHTKLVSAYINIKSNLSYLFTYKKHKNLSIANTTNSLEGGVFSPLKILIKIHRGLSKSLKLKIVDMITL